MESYSNKPLPIGLCRLRTTQFWIKSHFLSTGGTEVLIQEFGSQKNKLLKQDNPFFDFNKVDFFYQCMKNFKG